MQDEKSISRGKLLWSVIGLRSLDGSTPTTEALSWWNSSLLSVVMGTLDDLPCGHLHLFYSFFLMFWILTCDKRTRFVILSHMIIADAQRFSWFIWDIQVHCLLLAIFSSSFLASRSPHTDKIVILLVGDFTSWGSNTMLFWRVIFSISKAVHSSSFVMGTAIQHIISPLMAALHVSFLVDMAVSVSWRSYE